MAIFYGGNAVQREFIPSEREFIPEDGALLTMKIAFLGDSLTAGWPGASYLALLRAGFADHELLDYGRAGDTVADLEARMSRGGMPSVDLAFVWIGVNDAFSGERLFLGGDNQPRGLRSVFERLIDFVCEHVGTCVCVPPLLPDNGPPVEGIDYVGFDWPTLRSRVQAIAALIGEVAAARAAVRLLDLRGPFDVAGAADSAAAFTIDGVHLSDRGAEVVADALGDAIRDALASED
jgi:lysophospholipase L1-like esterase